MRLLREPHGTRAREEEPVLGSRPSSVTTMVLECRARGTHVHVVRTPWCRLPAPLSLCLPERSALRDATQDPSCRAALQRL